MLHMLLSLVTPSDVCVEILDAGAATCPRPHHNHQSFCMFVAGRSIILHDYDQNNCTLLRYRGPLYHWFCFVPPVTVRDLLLGRGNAQPHRR